MAKPDFPVPAVQIVVCADMSSSVFPLSCSQKPSLVQRFQILITLVLREAGELCQLADSIVPNRQSIQQRIVRLRCAKAPPQLPFCIADIFGILQKEGLKILLKAFLKVE